MVALLYVHIIGGLTFLGGLLALIVSRWALVRDEGRVIMTFTVIWLTIMWPLSLLYITLIMLRRFL